MKGKDYSRLTSKKRQESKQHTKIGRAINESANLMEQQAFEEESKPKMQIMFNTFRQWIQLIPKDCAYEIIIELDKPLPIEEIKEKLKVAFSDFRQT